MLHKFTFCLSVCFSIVHHQSTKGLTAADFAASVFCPIFIWEEDPVSMYWWPNRPHRCEKTGQKCKVTYMALIVLESLIVIVSWHWCKQQINSLHKLKLQAYRRRWKCITMHDIAGPHNDGFKWQTFRNGWGQSTDDECKCVDKVMYNFNYRFMAYYLWYKNNMQFL